MAQKNDIVAAKARKQMIILAVAGVALVGLAVIQGPKLLKSNSQPAAAPAETSTAVTGTGVATPTPTTGTAVVVGSTTGTLKPAAYVAGVALPGGSKAVVASSQLASFTLFEVKDPFVQQASEETGTSPTSDAATASTDAAAPTASGATATGAAGTSTAPPPVTFATIMLDGKPQQLQVGAKKVDRQFPQEAPLFVLVSLKKKQAKIGVAGGSFDDGQSVTLAFGKKLTLVDTATGVRYELKLVYTGTAPEQIEGFSTAEEPTPTVTPTVTQPAATDGGTTAAATP